MESTILSHLIYNEKYGRKVLPYLKAEYFQNTNNKILFNIVSNHINKYNAFPSKEALYIDLSELSSVSEDQYKEVQRLIQEAEIDPVTNFDWLVDQTEKFCQDQSLFNAIHESIRIMDGKSKLTKDALPKLLQDALQVSFDSHIGHDFIEDSDERFELLRRAEERIDFDIDLLNRITQNGLPRKSMTCLLSPTGGGKSLVMCHMAAHNLMCGKNVLYITMEMAEERIAQRIDANLLDVPINDLIHMSKMNFDSKMEKIKKTTRGKLIIKEYPTAGAGSSHFRQLLNELRIKKNFVPDIVYVDYLNICLSSRIKPGSQVNSYTYVKAIAEELRGIAVEFNFPLITATQANRGGYGASDIDLENTSDSIGLPMTVDLMLAVISTDELTDLNQIMFKQLKNRFGDINRNKRFVVGIDKSKMRLYNVDQSAQEDILDGPEVEESSVFDQSVFGYEDEERSKQPKKFDKSKFKGFR